MSLLFSSRSLIFGVFLAMVGMVAIPTPARADAKKVYAWHPERATSGPILIVVDLDVQVAYVYRNGIEIGRTGVSTGRAGHRTPTGVFSILGKDVHHHSSIYNNASMPYAERLTWSGVFLHAGGLPGYPSSHGCVHLPLAFAKDLFAVTGSDDTTVVITANATPPAVSQVPIERLAGLEKALESAEVPAGKIFWKPELNPKGSVAVVVSQADGKVEVLRGGVLIGSGSVGFPAGTTLSEAVYLKLASGGWGKRAQWVTVDVGSGTAPTWSQLKATGIKIDPALVAKMKGIMKPGALVVTTASPLAASKRSGPGFVGISSAPQAGH